MHVKKRCTALLLTLCLLVGMLPTGALAAGSDSAGDLVVVSTKEYAIAPDITERELITNNSSLSAQQAGHIMEVKLGGYADIIVGYNDYNIPAIQSGSNWGMEEPTSQAQNAETRRGVNVVGAVNGDFFNMSNGAPSGALIMNGTEIKGGTSPCFWIDSANRAHISANSTAMKEEAASLGVTVREAIGGNTILVEDGARTVTGSTYGDAPNPRTVAGIKADGTVVIYMVNGRQSPYSVGMDYGQLADIMLSQGCVDAMNLDGGGSSVFATQREGESNDNGKAGLTIRCRPSDGYERSVSSCLLVVSKAEQTGEFDHASLSPSDEIYTPGSQVQFTAQGVDAGGGPAALPGSGLTWSVTGGTGLGSIDAATGLFTAAVGATGQVEVTLSYNGAAVGSTTIQLQWPDQLAFTNTSVSLDFGETSDLSFSPTWQGREVHYKEGDFTWSLVENEELSYKGTLPVEVYTKPGWGGYDQQLLLSVTGNIGGTQTATAYYGNYLVYETTYQEDSRTISVLEDGTLQVNETISHQTAALYSHVDGSLLKDNITQDVVNETLGGSAQNVIGIKPTQTASFTLGKFQDNRFTADEDASLKGTIQVALADDPSVTGTVTVIVGMEPVVLMDFEGGHTDPISGEVLSAEDYWTYHVGMSKANGGNSLSLQERQDYRLMIRDTTNKGVQWPEGENRLVSSTEDSRVRFGNYALQLAWDFTPIAESQVAAADFGFSSLIYAHVVQPTKIGFWINVPADLAGDTSQVKMIFVGGITEISDTTESDEENPGLENAYWDMDAEGNLTWHPHELPKGTTQYLNYYSYDSDGNVTGSQLADWAGKGWTWIEADLSGAQFPIGIQYGYTIRIVSPQNYVKNAGSILIDNLQLIYGTNTNDIYNPVVDSVTETSTGTSMSGDGSVFDTGSLSFEVTYSDNELTDKYATGIDVGSIQVSIDGQDYTAEATIGTSSLTFAASGLVNGSHNLTVRVKDLYGNETTVTRQFTVDDDAGANALVTVAQPEQSPVVAGSYTLTIANLDAQPMERVSVTLQLPSAYTSEWSVAGGEGYEASGTLEGSSLTITAARSEEGTPGEAIASITFAIPADAREGDSFQYTVTSGSYVTSAGATASFSQPQVTIPLTASYTLSADGAALAGFPAVLTVKDGQGQPVAGAEVFLEGGSSLGTTGDDGTLTHTFSSAGRTTLYALAGAGRSWNTAVVVNAVSTEGPFAVQANGSADGATQRTVTWLSPIGASLEGITQLRLSSQDGGWDTAQVIEGVNEVVAFTETSSGTALRLNTVKLTGLTPLTTYYYQVGDGTVWSDTYTFTTASGDPEGETNFFVFADIQTSSTANLAAAISRVKESGIPYAFGIQTGDAIDNVTAFSNWRGYLTVLNAQSLGAIDVLHTLGNHEYYGDADGSMAGSMFALPAHEAGSFYSAEYGSVYAAVVNNGGDLKAALEGVRTDAADSECTWKVLVVHEPIYGTVEEMDAEARGELTAIIEEAGIDFVFTGDDHAFARTVPLKGDVEVEAEDGVVYYICGDLSGKDNEFHGDRPYFAAAIPHSEYGGMYLSVQTDGSKMTISAYDCQGNLLDTYSKSKEKSPCDLGQHTYSEESTYDLTTGQVACALCGEAVSAEESGYTGLLNTSGNEGQVLLVQGALQKDGWFTWGEEMCHVAVNGLIHSIVPLVDTATCLTNGQLRATCTQCGDIYRGQSTWAKGHTWDADHVCTVCGAQGINIAEAELEVEYLYYSYTGAAIRPRSEATYGGRILVASSDRYGTDAYISYENNTNIGVGTVTYEGRGNFYGSISQTFTIVPASVSTIWADSVSMDSVTLSWNAAKGAQTYLIQQLQIIDGEEAWVRVGSTSQTSFTVVGLSRMTNYTFRVNSMATVDGKNYYCLNYSNELKVTTPDDLTQYTETYVTSMACSLPGQTLQPQQVDGARWLFLPSSADLTSLALNFTLVEGESRTLTLSGNLGSLTLEGTAAQVDLTSLASKSADGSYTLSVSLADLAPLQVKVMASASVAAMYLTSADPENQGQDYVDADKGNSAEGSMTLVAADGAILYNGALTQIKSRGNSTFLYYDKKSYQIKLDSKSDLLGLGEKGKTWVLLAGYGDATQMHDKLFKDLASQVGLAYSPDCDWVDLYYDGEYRGTYLLSEKNNVNGNTVDITDMEKLYEDIYPDYGDSAVTAEDTNAYGQSYSYTQGLAGPEDLTGGYLLELNHNTIDEANGFHTRQEVAFNIKSPEYGSQEAVQYISEYYQEFEDAVYATDAAGNYTGLNPNTGKYYYEYCDLDSLVRLFLVQQFSSNSDAFASSVFFYKDAGGIMYAGPVWDMEMSCGTGWDEYITPDRDFLQLRYLTEALMQIPSFIDAVEQCFDETFAPAAQALLGSDGVIAEYTDTLSASSAMNYVLWPYVRVGNPGHEDHLWGEGTTYSDVAADLSDWLERRLDILTQRYGGQQPDIPAGSVTFQKGTALTRTYGDASFTNSASAEGVAGGFTYSSSNPAVAMVEPVTGEVTIVGAGSTVITAAAGALSGQYQLTIQPKKITALTWSSDRLIYTGQPIAPTATAKEGLVEGDEVTFSVPKATEPGTYQVTAVSQNPNYVVAADVTPHQFTIVLPTITLSKTDGSVTAHMDGTSIVLSGLVGRQEETITVTVSDGSQDGSATVSAGQTDAVVHLSGVAYGVDAGGLAVKPTDVTLTNGKTDVVPPAEGVTADLEDAQEEQMNKAAGSEENKFTNILAAIASAVEEIVEDALDKVEGEVSSVKMEVSQQLEVTEYKPGTSYKVDITPVYQIVPGAEDGEEAGGEPDPSAELIASGTLSNDQITAPVEVSIQVPSDIELNEHTYIKHYLPGGVWEYLTPSFEEGSQVLTFWTSSFSEFEVVSDRRTGSVTFPLDDGDQTRVFTPADLGTELPVLTKDGYTFHGWTIGSNTYTEVDENFLNALNDEKTLTAAASFTQNETPVEPEDPDPGQGGGGGGGGGGGSVSTDYAVTAADSANGAVSFSADAAAKGETVTITVTPDAGYALDTLTVSDAGGDEIGVTDLGNGQYSFTMPGSKVTVKATFKPIEEDPAPVKLPFTDVAEGAWYYDAVAYAYDNGLMGGTSASTFAPGTTTSRAMLATLLYRLEGEPAVTGASFTDVAAGQWYSDAVAWAAAEGIVNGVGDGSVFAPNDTITREQMAVMLYRYAQYKGYDVTGSADLSGYTDAGSISSWAEYAMAWAVDAGLISGTGAAILSPQGSASRAEIATILMRFCESVVK